MSELTNYIKERIETLKEKQKNAYSYSGMLYPLAIEELQAVLSKIEEI